MDKLLGKRLNLLNKQSEKLAQAHGEFLLTEAGKDSLKAELFLAQPADLSQKDREARALSDEKWRIFMRHLAEKETAFHFEKRRYSILENAYYGELATYKNEMSLISKEKINP